MKRNMEFIVEQQAQFVSDVQSLQERDAAAEKRMERGERRLDRLETILRGALRAGVRERRETREKFNALIDAQQRTEEALTRLAESQVHTDERLDALIGFVQNRNGKP